MFIGTVLMAEAGTPVGTFFREVAAFESNRPDRSLILIAIFNDTIVSVYNDDTQETLSRRWQDKRPEATQR